MVLGKGNSKEPGLRLKKSLGDKMKPRKPPHLKNNNNNNGT